MDRAPHRDVYRKPRRHSRQKLFDPMNGNYRSNRSMFLVRAVFVPGDHSR